MEVGQISGGGVDIWREGLYLKEGYISEGRVDIWREGRYLEGGQRESQEEQKLARYALIGIIMNALILDYTESTSKSTKSLQKRSKKLSLCHKL